MVRPAHEEKIMTDSIDTMTAPSHAATTVYPTHATKIAAPREGKDLLLQIDVGDNAATVHCREEETVGNHENRKVIFLADRACTLMFDHQDVFGTNQKTIPKNTKTPIEVSLPLGKTGWTNCEVLPIGTAKVLPTKHASPPKIIVP